MTSQYITSHYSTVHPFRIHNPLGRTAVAVAVVVAVTLAAAMAMAMAMAMHCTTLHYITFFYITSNSGLLAPDDKL